MHRAWKDMAAMAAAGALSVALLLSGCSSPTTGAGTPAAEKKDPIKIGAVLSLTGSYAGLGAPEKNVLDMEAKRLNDAGGIGGRPVEIIIVDDATDPAKAQAAATRLIEQDKVVALIGATGTGQTMAMRGDVDRAGVPQLSVAGGTVITQQFDKLVFQTPWSNTLVVPFTLKRLQKLGIKKIGVIADSGGFGKDGIAVIKAEAPKFGMTVTSEQSFNPGDTDMTGQLTKIKGSGAQAVVLWSAGKEAATVAKNLKQLNMGIPLVGSHGNARKEFIEGAGDAAEGFTFAAGKILVPAEYGEGTEGFKVATDFTKRYTEAYKTGPDTFAGHAYDAFWLLAGALKSAGPDADAAKLRDAVEQTTGFVGIGGTFNFTATDHNGLTEADLVTYEVKNGAWVVQR
ncbi:MAG: ABC transporter substrate-binding protein [Coriobacteriia bacterium]|nr:ABC transporter substrate-binding protein [Coriobacteriia bacterium]